jgi:hypothetical protein
MGSTPQNPLSSVTMASNDPIDVERSFPRLSREKKTRNAEQ